MKVKNLIKRFSNRKVVICVENGDSDWELTREEALTCDLKIDFFSIFYDKDTEEWVVDIEVF